MNDKINDTDKIIVEAIKNDKYVTISDLSAKAKKSLPTIHRHLDNLSKQGLIGRMGSRKAGYWYVK
ncbi:MAG TPA: hypothetical protein DDW18_04675 [Firmicutes bacterium]|nr:hypothetical protein [Bacillota bacterium]